MVYLNVGKRLFCLWKFISRTTLFYSILLFIFRNVDVLFSMNVLEYVWWSPFLLCYILAEDAGGDCKCICLKRTDFRVYIFSRILVDFAKSNTRETFFLNSICEKIYTPNKHNINILWRKYAKGNMHKKCWLIQLFLESINNSLSIVTCLSFRWSWQKH